MIAANYPHILLGLLLVTNVLQINNVYKLHSWPVKHRVNHHSKWL